MRVMLLAAGLGTRLRPITNRFAKPAVPFLNVPLLFWSLEFLRELAPDRVIANLHYLPDTIRALKPQVEKSGFELRFTHEVAAPLGSGGALWFAKKELEDSESILVANADEVILPVAPDTLKRMKAQHEKSDALATLLTMKHPEAGTTFGGVWTTGTNAVCGFGRDGKEFPQAIQALHYVGVLLLNRRIFKYLPEGESNLLYDAIKKAIASGERVQAFCEELVWHETGNPKDLLHATDAILDLISPKATQNTRHALAAKLATTVIQRHAPEATRLWESNSGSRLLLSSLAKGSLPESEICVHLEKKKKAFAVLGPNALVRSSVENSVVLPGAEVSSPALDTIVV